jgi:hypothetical protein
LQKGAGWERPPFLQPYRRAPEEKTHRNMGLVFKCRREGLDHPPFLSDMSVEENETRGSNEKKFELLKVPEMKESQPM